MRPSSHIYRASPQGTGLCLLQGEILSNVVRIRLDLNTLGADQLGVIKVTHEFAVVMTQHCDLEQDFKIQSIGQQTDKPLPNILFANVVTAEALRGSGGINSTIWSRIPANKDERYHFLQAVDASCDGQQLGLPEMGIDFKRYFTIPTDEIYKRIELGEAKRRCVLVSPYLEHLSSRFAYFLSRIGLPEEHFSEPVSKSVQPS